jgi:hypothetical protein
LPPWTSLSSDIQLREDSSSGTPAEGLRQLALGADRLHLPKTKLSCPEDKLTEIEQGLIIEELLHETLKGELPHLTSFRLEESV